MIPVNLAVEDELSEVVLRRLLANSRQHYIVGTVYRRGGFGYLRKTICGWNAAAKGIPFVVLTDLDKHECPPSLVADWLPVPRNPNLIFRVAVREVEAWLLADSDNLATFLRVSPTRLPADPDQLADPKQTLIDLARHSRSKELRDRLVPRNGSTAKQGPDYNGCLRSFVHGEWQIRKAAQNSASLRRAVGAFKLFKPSWPEVE